jgi:hypothetical protein
MVLAIVLGGGIAWYSGKIVKMTDMPQMVAIYNGMGGGAAAGIDFVGARLAGRWVGCGAGDSVRGVPLRAGGSVEARFIELRSRSRHVPSAR